MPSRNVLEDFMSNKVQWDASFDAGERCDICYCDYGDSEGDIAEKPAILPCGHKFGADCIKKWFTEKQTGTDKPPTTCPYCRASPLVYEINAPNRRRILPAPLREWLYNLLGGGEPVFYPPAGPLSPLLRIPRFRVERVPYDVAFAGGNFRHPWQVEAPPAAFREFEASIRWNLREVSSIWYSPHGFGPAHPYAEFQLNSRSFLGILDQRLAERDRLESSRQQQHQASRRTRTQIGEFCTRIDGLVMEVDELGNCLLEIIAQTLYVSRFSYREIDDERPLGISWIFAVRDAVRGHVLGLMEEAIAAGY